MIAGYRPKKPAILAGFLRKGECKLTLRLQPFALPCGEVLSFKWLATRPLGGQMTYR